MRRIARESIALFADVHALYGALAGTGGAVVVGGAYGGWDWRIIAAVVVIALISTILAAQTTGRKRTEMWLLSLRRLGISLVQNRPQGDTASENRLDQDSDTWIHDVRVALQRFGISNRDMAWFDDLGQKGNDVPGARGVVMEKIRRLERLLGMRAD